MSPGDIGGQTRGGVRGRWGLDGPSFGFDSSVGADPGTTWEDSPSSVACTIVASEEKS